LISLAIAKGPTTKLKDMGIIKKLLQMPGDHDEKGA
jgi:hypothetical protein